MHMCNNMYMHMHMCMCMYIVTIITVLQFLWKSKA